ncbi:hypothetical protein V1525DRAFT_452824 [Lipomyces kononenkoae]|uniref:Uncharacterized protein n=1 Tax=Lipomyces kononenkoae TaxID=34357 RepID=A0ACC3SRI8_LIPKO
MTLRALLRLTIICLFHYILPLLYRATCATEAFVSRNSGYFLLTIASLCFYLQYVTIPSVVVLVDHVSSVFQ